MESGWNPAEIHLDSSGGGRGGALLRRGSSKIRISQDGATVAHTSTNPDGFLKDALRDPEGFLKDTLRNPDGFRPIPEGSETVR